MGITASSSLLLKGANSKFDIPMYQTPMSESYYLPSLHFINEMNDELRQAKLEFYEMVQTDFLTEGNVLKAINDKILAIIGTILKIIKKIKDAIIGAFSKFMSNNKTKKSVNMDDLYESIESYYDKDIYINMNIYPNTLNNRLTDSKIPDSAALFTDVDFDRMLDNINDVHRNALSADVDELKTNLQSQKTKLTKDRVNVRKILTGKPIDINDLNDVSKFRKDLSEFYIGSKSDTVITRNIAIKSIDNLENYYDIREKFYKAKGDVEKRYNQLTGRVETFRKQAIAELSNLDSIGDTDNEKKVSIIAQTAIALSDTVNSFLQDHLLAFTVKMESITIMQAQDTVILDTVKAALERSGKTSIDECTLEREHYDDMDESLTSYCEGCFMLHEMMEDHNLLQFIQESVLLEEDGAKPGFKDNVERVVNMIVEMFKKFLLSLNQLVGVDKKWFEQNEKTIKDSNFKFPAGDSEIPDWIPYRADLLQKSFDMQPFDAINTQLLNDLKDEETFAKTIYQKMGGSETDIKDDEAKNGSFAIKCKAIYSGGKPEKITVSQLQQDKDKFFDYCKGYMEGENGGVYKSISNDTKKLDQSKKNVQRALKNNEANNKSTQSTETNQNNKAEESKAGQTAAPQNAGEQQNTSDVKESFGFDFDLAKTFGLCENEFLQELTTPDVAKADSSAVKDNIAGGAEDNSIKELKEKSNRYFTMMGNALGAKMTASMQCYKQYKSLFKWALKSTTDRSTENNDSVKGKEKPVENNESIEGAAKEKK